MRAKLYKKWTGLCRHDLTTTDLDRQYQSSTTASGLEVHPDHRHGAREVSRGSKTNSRAAEPVCNSMSLCLYVSMSVCLYACLYVCMYVWMYVYMYVCLSLCLSVCLSYVCLSVCISVCMYVCLYVCFSACMSVRLHLYMYVYLTVCIIIIVVLRQYLMCRKHEQCQRQGHYNTKIVIGCTIP